MSESQVKGLERNLNSNSSKKARKAKIEALHDQVVENMIGRKPLPSEKRKAVKSLRDFKHWASRWTPERKEE
jgi:hypothetical protein